MTTDGELAAESREKLFDLEGALVEAWTQHLVEGGRPPQVRTLDGRLWKVSTASDDDGVTLAPMFESTYKTSSLEWAWQQWGPLTQV